MIRSVLFVPGVRPDRFAKALESGADVVVLDWEDSVDAERKGEARDAVGGFLAATPAAGAPSARRFIRVNGVSSRWFRDDFDFIAGLDAAAFDGVVLPKAETATDVETIGRALESHVVIPLIESARGVLNAAAIATANASIPAVLFGAEDLTAQIGIPRTVDGDELIYARSQVVLAATAAGIDAIDAVFIDINDVVSLRQDATRARAIGFRGKMAIHPSQVPVIHEVFTPSAAELGRARALVAAYDASVARGDAVFRYEDRMIDAPVVDRARRVLERGPRK